MDEVRDGLKYPLLESTFPLYKRMIKQWDKEHLVKLIYLEMREIRKRREKGETAQAVVKYFLQNKGSKPTSSL